MSGRFTGEGDGAGFALSIRDILARSAYMPYETIKEINRHLAAGNNYLATQVLIKAENK